MSQLKRTPLYEVYKDQAKMVNFSGWELPVQFSGIIAEHEAVRTRAGLFDVSHMGEVEISGPDALDLIQRLTTNDASKLVPGKAQYSIMCYPNGGTVDDLLIYRGTDSFLLVLNAANVEKDVEWIEKHASGEVRVRNLSNQMAQLALQGPLAERVLGKLTDADLSSIGFFRFRDDVKLAGTVAMVSRTGYTGEDGFEIYLNPEDAPKVWREILEAGKEEGVLPCGLGARDTLRFEACLPLYGRELSPNITPIEAGLGFAVKPEKGDFIGRDVLAEQKAEGPPRKLVGLEMIDRGIPRTHYPVYAGEEKIGEVTTGTQSPTLKKSVGLALIRAEYAEPGNEVEVEIRGRRLRAAVVKTPFYRRPKK
ncbi:aminomethyltransferase [Planifilum fulgidum]|uniref:Aminomethyltransferase n=1 Tax=Planifilum fulgidum TaxID=201973 RepID=A0A1I2QZR8_9BACL|nr:glycine cleavage system aminomethyltransferase GcvT [Planifilum fulgidum]MBO2495368.1 glycine cleavage system protein T [Bacillota bacterium]MBO2534049.1 glycine cleavage system protein T [Thermoactinomycetaceae bacterium]SFG32759.1 aminomethyltransferase [Planifilum fulgidum]